MNGYTYLALLLAAALGTLIGVERQWNQGMAGLRTNALVAFGAASFVTLGRLAGAGGNPDRMAAMIVSGIGFLGAGVIFREGASVRGLNTAATLWCSAAAGALAGAGLSAEASFCAVGVVAINLGLRRVKEAISRHAPHPVDVETIYRIEIRCAAAAEANLRALLLDRFLGSGLSLKSLHSDRSHRETCLVAALSAHQRLDSALEAIVSRIGAEEGVGSVRWSISEGAGASTLPGPLLPD